MVTLTEAAGVHVRKMLGGHGSALGLRLGVKRSGCSGLAYVVDYAEQIGEEDRVFESQGVRVVVDRDSLGALDGTEIDFVSESLLNRGFEFRNPRMKETCGCGESFSV